LLISRLLLSVRGILIPKFLGPAQYGIYNGLLILPDFLAHFHFGSLSALKREIPFCYGKNDFAQARRIQNVVFSQYLCTVLLSVFLIFVFSFFIADRYSSLVINSLRLVCLFILIQSLVDPFLENLLRTDNRFDVLSHAEIFKSVVGLLLMLLMIWFWQLYGLIASLILGALLKGLYIFYKTDYHFKWIWDFIELKRLVGIGFPIISGLILMTFYNSIDRFFIIKYLDARQLGYYALGLTFAKFLLIIQNGVYGVLEPKVYRLYGEKGEIGALKDMVWEPVYLMSIFYPLLVGLVYIGVPYLLYLFLPKYLPSLSCIRIMILGSFAFTLVEGAYTFIVAVNRQGFIVKITGIGIVINIVFNYLLIRQGWGIEGVALATAATSLIIALLFLFFILIHFFEKIRARVIPGLQIFLPIILTGFFLVLADYFWPVHGRLKEEAGLIGMKVVLLLVILSPFFWQFKKRIARLGELIR
jgi:O-antigen/teichoic acid export membrane protein